MVMRLSVLLVLLFFAAIPLAWSAVDGNTILANIFRLGRISLFYQSLDRSVCGFYNMAESDWRPLLCGSCVFRQAKPKRLFWKRPPRKRKQLSRMPKNPAAKFCKTARHSRIQTVYFKIRSLLT